MSFIKTPPLQPKNETVQLRLSQIVKFRLARYAEFIHASPSYIVAEMLEHLFRKDTEFQAYLAAYKPTETEDNPEGVVTQSPALNSTKR